MAEQPAARETPRRIPPALVIAPAEYGMPEAAAWQALAVGNATKDQQLTAVKWLLESCCRTYDLSFRPGEGGDRDTAFAEGMRYVGLQVVKLIRLNIEKLRKRT